MLFVAIQETAASYTHLPEPQVSPTSFKVELENNCNKLFVILFYFYCFLFFGLFSFLGLLRLLISQIQLFTSDNLGRL